MITSRRFLIVLAITFAVFCVLALRYFPTKRPATQPAAVTVSAPVPPSVPKVIPAPAAEKAAPAPIAVPENKVEIVATARMYAAHASLRTPEVADPDSQSNKLILQTMVQKALAQSTAPSRR